MQSSKKLTIWFQKSNLKLYLYDNPVADLIYHKYKHLGQLSINFNDSDIFFQHDVNDFDLAVKKLNEYANQLNVTIVYSKLQDQIYLNFLHELYEKNFNGNELWLKFHEHIHVIEKILYNRVHPILSIDYRTKAGKLEEKFDRNFLKYGVSQVTKNQCFIQWQELAKTPYQYFANKEPNNIKRLCELVLPWVTLRPSLHIACDTIDFLDNIDFDAFDKWFSNYKEQWCQHWNLVDWTNREPFLVIPVGEIESSSTLIDNIKNNDFPLRVTQ